MGGGNQMDRRDNAPDAAPAEEDRGRGWRNNQWQDRRGPDMRGGERRWRDGNWRNSRRAERRHAMRDDRNHRRWQRNQWNQTNARMSGKAAGRAKSSDRHYAGRSRFDADTSGPDHGARPAWRESRRKDGWSQYRSRNQNFDDSLGREGDAGKRARIGSNQMDITRDYSLGDWVKM